MRPPVAVRLLPALLAAAFPFSICAQEATALRDVRVSSTTIDDRFESRHGEPSSTGEISGKTVDERRPDNIVRVLQRIPGLTADQSSGDELKIKFRGIENQRYMGEKPGVAIVIDGVPVFERTGKVNVDIDNIENIKVVKGGASYLFGEDALAGAVIVTTKRGAKYKGVTVAQDYGSWGYDRSLVRVGLADEWGSGHLQATNRSSDDYYFQSPYSTEELNGSLRFNLSDRSDLTVNFEDAKRRKDKHGNVTGALQASIDPTGIQGRDYARKFNVDLSKLNATYAKEVDANTNMMVTGYQYTDHTQFWSAPLNARPTGNVGNGQSVTDVNAYTTLNDYHQTQQGAKGEWRSHGGDWAWLFGGDLRHNEYRNRNSALADYCSAIFGCNYGAGIAKVTRKGTVLTDDLTKEQTRAAYGELKWAASPTWILTGNLRADVIDMDYRGNPTVTNNNVVVTGKKQFRAFSWRAGSNWALREDTSLFANLATGFRTPTAEQLYAGSISPAAGKTLNNDGLRPEVSMNYEMGVNADLNLGGLGAKLQTSIFQIDRRDYIMSTLGQYGAGGSTTFQQKYDNIGGVRNRGLEVAFNTDPKREFSLDVAYTLIDARFTQYDNFNQILGNQYGTAWAGGAFNPNSQYKVVHWNNTGRTVPRVSRHQLFSTLNWNPAEKWRVAFEMDARSWAWADEINQEKWAGRTLFNIGVNYDMREAGFMGAKWSLFARVDNLFNRKYWNAARGTNDAKSALTPNVYDGAYNANDLSIIVGKPRGWFSGVQASF